MDKRIVLCPACQTDYGIASDLLGREAICRNCKTRFILSADVGMDTRTLFIQEGSDQPDDSMALGYDLKSSVGTRETGSAEEQHRDVVPDETLPGSDPMNQDTPEAVAAEDEITSKPSGVDSSRSTSHSLRSTNDSQSSSSFGKASDDGAVPEVWKVGDVLLEVYEVRPLSDDLDFQEGGMGLVHRVFHRDWNLDLAVKSPKRETMQSEFGKTSFERECQTWIELGMHPNIVTCYLVRRMGGIPRVFAEFVEDGSLRDWIRDRRLYEGGHETSVRRILDIAIQFAWGLQHAHRNGVIHLDVKPANVMMQGDVAKVTDFGLAKAQMSVTKPGDSDSHDSDSRDDVSQNGDSQNVDLQEVGVTWEGMTPAFCSPEQRQASLQHLKKNAPEDEVSILGPDNQVMITRATDVWSWALSVLTMFHGRAPCRKGGHTAGQVFELYLKQESRDEFLPEMPPGLIELLRECFQTKPSDRPDGMIRIADRLIRIYEEVAGEPYTRQPPPDTELTADSLNNRAASMLDLNKRHEAARFLNDAWQLRPWHPRVTYNRDLLAWRAGQLPDLEVVARMQELCKTHADDPDSWLALALIQKERADYKASTDALEKAVALVQTRSGRKNDAAMSELGAFWHDLEPLLEDSAMCISSHNALVSTKSEPTEVTPLLVNRDNSRLITFSDERSLNMHFAPGIQAAAQPAQTLTRSSNAKRQTYLSRDLKWELRCDADQKTSESADTSRVKHPGRPGVGDSDLALFETSSDQMHDRFRRIAWGRCKAVMSRDELVVAGVGPEPDCITVTHQKTGQQRRLIGHVGPVTAISMTGDGTWLLSGGTDTTIRLWNALTGQCVHTFRSHNQPIDGVYLAQNGCWAASVSGQRGVRLWNMARLACAAQRPRPVPYLLCHVTSSDEAARTQNESLALLEQAKVESEAGRIAESLRLIRQARELPGYETMRKRFSTWEMGGRHSIRTGSLRALCMKSIHSESGQVRVVRLSFDSRWIVSGGWSGTVELRSAETGAVCRELAGHSDWIRDLAILPGSGAILSAGWDTTLRLWNAASGEMLRVFHGHKKQIETLDVDPTGQLAASGGWDKTVRIWRIADGECLRTLEGHEHYIQALAISPDVQRIVSVDEAGSLRVWEIATGRCLKVFASECDKLNDVAFSPCGNFVATAGNDAVIRLLGLQDGSARSFRGHNGEVNTLRYAADGRWIVSGSRDRTLRLWSVEDGSCHRKCEGHVEAVTCLDMSRDSRYVLSGSDDDTIRLWRFDWDYTFPGWADWDDRAAQFVRRFVLLRAKRLTDVNESLLDRLMTELQYRGFGYLRRDGVRKQVEQLY